MFDNNMFEEWLDKKAAEVFEKVGRGESIRSEEMMILVLKAQANHFMHLDTDLRREMKDLREDMKELREDMLELREDMNRRFEVVDKRFEAVDKRFEAMDKRFSSMQWLIGLGITFMTVLMSLYRFFQ